MATPENQAREHIDRQLKSCGWVVQDFQQFNLTAGLGVGEAVLPFWALFKSMKNR